MTEGEKLKNGFLGEPLEVHFDVALTDSDSDEKNPLIKLRRKSKEIRRPSITLSREFSTTSTGETGLAHFKHFLPCKQFIS